MWFPPENTIVNFSLGCESLPNGDILDLYYQFNHMEFRWRQRKEYGEHFQLYQMLSFNFIKTQ